METEQVPEEQGHKKGRHRKKQLYNSILQQMEFYFSDSNLAKDRFLAQLIQTDPNIEISVFLKFNKLRKLTTNIEDITKAVSKSEIIQLSEDKTRVHRKLPIKIKQDVDDCTIYVERLKSDATHEWLKSIFLEFGNVVYVSIPKYKHNEMIKGFAFVEFEHAEGAKAAMQYFESINCKISSDIEPQKLCSIASYDPNEKSKCMKKNNAEENSSDAKMDEDITENEQKNSIELKQETANTNISKGDNEIKKSKHSRLKMNEDEEETLGGEERNKLKIEDKPETSEDVQQKKRKHSEVETGEDMQEVSGGETKKLKIKHESETNEGVQQEAMSDGEVEEKKKKKHKKSNRKKINLKEIGLQILSKKDWKKMRNRYLEMQRKTMKQLKMHLNKQRFGNRYLNRKHHMEEQNNETENKQKDDAPKGNHMAKEETQSFIPGTIVKVSLSEPCENNKKLKTEFKELSSEIKYVDIPWKVGSEEVYVRFSDSENAQAFCASNFSKGKSCILEGNEEKIYWEKIEANRQEKQKKMVGKQRGRDKLLKKAERQAAKHVRFDDNDSE